MKISKSKQELAIIISENGGWRDGAEWAAQCKLDVTISFYSGCAPYRDGDCWWGDHLDGTEIKIIKLMPNWHQTVLSREEYLYLYTAPDADGWIEWNGVGDVPHNEFMLVDTRHRSGHIETANRICDMWWDAKGIGNDIIAYRLHKPEQAKHEFCESVTRSIPEPESKPTIEQLAADYRNRKGYADRKHAEAVAAKAEANEALRKLELAGEAIGLIVTPPRVEKESEVVITDWRDLKVGDEIEYVDGSLTYMFGLTGNVVDFDEHDSESPVRIHSSKLKEAHEAWPRRWRFIRRP